MEESASRSARRSDTCVFTIVSNNYLHFANTLFESVRKHSPDVDIVLGLCDVMSDATDCPEADDIIEIGDLEVAKRGAFAFQYTILELNTAIKPYVIEALMDRGYSKVVYFDPDIMLFGAIGSMLELLDQHNVLLTPHLTDLLDDGKTPDELHILRAGTYNLGFIALRECEETRKLLRWWQSKLYKDCVVDLPRGLFVDQKWMDLAPAMFDGVFVNRDTSWNVAYWNLNHRQLEPSENSQYLVDGRPLTFFHFSGFSIGADTLSKHQNRFDRGSAGSALRKICSEYEAALLRNGAKRFASIPYAFASLADGTVIPASARRVIRESQRLADVDFFDSIQCQQVHAEINAPVQGDPGTIPLTALALSLWRARSDLSTAFPAIDRADRMRFAEWLVEVAPREEGFPEIYVIPIRQALERGRLGSAAPGPDRAWKRMFSKLLRAAWERRQWMPLRMRQSMPGLSAWALSKAYPRHPSAMEAPPIPASQEPGVNLIGYLHAESGVGEAARASLRALRHSDLPYSLIDYRLGNVSRMGEVLDGHVNRAYYPINLLHVNADQSRIAREHIGSEVFEGRYTIGYWYWEMPHFPDFLTFAFDQVDEVWVSSEYNRQTISHCTDKPVCLIPPAIDVVITKPLDREDLHLPSDTFIFFHMSDVLSVPERKNPLGVIEAFMRAFGDEPTADVKLVIKLSNLDYQPELSEKVFELIDQDPRIQIIHEYLDRNTLNNLVRACDCYVSLHRAEGFGLPIAESMFLGKPVIATNWSGNVDMMDSDNSLPIRYQLTTLQKDYGPYKRGQEWAEPDLADAAEKMRWIADPKERPRAQDIGQRASETIKSRYGATRVAAMVEDRVIHIMSVSSH